MTDEYVTLYNQKSGQYEHYDPKALANRIRKIQKELGQSVISFGEAVQRAKDSLMDFAMSLGLSPRDGGRLPRGPFMTLMTETDYRVRPIAIKKGGWGRCLRKLEITCTTCESQQDSAETM